VDFHICWSIDCESARPEINDIELGGRAIEGFCEMLESFGWKGTLFLVPEEIEPLAELLGRMNEAGHEIGLHIHPALSGRSSDYLGVYSADEQMEIVGNAIEVSRRVLDVQPVSFRSGYGSANDHTFSVLAGLGFKQTSISFPGRRMSELASNWAGAPLFAHYVNPHNRFLQGGLDIVEFPISVDCESMIWGGIHPQDLRVEYTDAKNHGFAIRKIMKKQIDENLPVKALLPFTHNIFDYSDKNNFRRKTMWGMIEKMIRMEKALGVSLKGITIAEAGKAYRAVMPFDKQT